MAGYTVIDNDLLENEELSHMEILTLIYLIRFDNKLKGYAYPSLEVLKKLLGYSHIKYVIKIINSLVAKGYIRKETVKQRNHYFILKGKVSNVPNVYNVPNVQNKSKGEVQNVPKDYVQNVPTTITNTNTNTNTIYISLKFIDDVIDKVKITKEQYEKLINKYSKDLVHKNINGLDNYITNGKGETYKEHYRVLNTWCKENSSNTSSLKEGQVVDGWSRMNQFN
ncbi:MAG TPA: helix-turn-helix domain-containing protein [Clostridium sp.]|uniref:helix-turn-helix domain-containing protein n=1 Tax=Clostridium sp. TaxID=1506 RepID=UPI002F942D1B